MVDDRMVVGADVGGTWTKAVGVSMRGRPLGLLARMETLARRGPRDFAGRLAALLDGLAGKSGRRLAAAGLGLAGEVDAGRGMLRTAPNLRGWEGFGFKAELGRSLGVRVAVDNDANMAAWGGYVLELGRRPRHAVCVTLGTGVGGGVILDGRLHRGASGSAGEIGHLCVEPDGESCHCGRRGCLEAYAGAYGIARTARKLLAGRRKAGPLERLCPGLKGLEPRLIALAARRGDAAARAVWRVTAHYLGLGIADVVYLLNPEAVLLAGGVAGAGRLLLDPVRRFLDRQPFRLPFRSVRLRLAGTPHLGALGAALMALEEAA